MREGGGGGQGKCEIRIRLKLFLLSRCYNIIFEFKSFRRVICNPFDFKLHTFSKLPTRSRREEEEESSSAVMNQAIEYVRSF